MCVNVSLCLYVSCFFFFDFLLSFILYDSGLFAFIVVI